MYIYIYIYICILFFVWCFSVSLCFVSSPMPATKKARNCSVCVRVRVCGYLLSFLYQWITWCIDRTWIPFVNCCQNMKKNVIPCRMHIRCLTTLSPTATTTMMTTKTTNGRLGPGCLQNSPVGTRALGKATNCNPPLYWLAPTTGVSMSLVC